MVVAFCKNLLTADALLTIFIASRNETGMRFKQCLAIAGVNGTLKFFKNTPLENNLRAKSGYLRYTWLCRIFRYS